MQDQGVADLHTHSHFSDGLHTPVQVVEKAVAAGLAALALTDHDTLAGVHQAQAAAERLGVRLIPGVELSCRWHQKDIHLLGWFVDPAHRPLLTALQDLQQARERRLEQMLAALRRAGVQLTQEQVLARRRGPSTGRPHVAAALVAAGHAASIQHAFDLWLRPGRPGFVHLERLPAAEALRLIREAGGVTALAHPGLGVDQATISGLAGEGLTGLEVDHPRHTVKQRQRYGETARRLGLAVTAGSDDHGYQDRNGPVGSERTATSVLEALERQRP